LTTFNAIAGQSLLDVCLNTYGSLDFLYKLLQDNGISSLNSEVASGQAFVWDDSLVVNQAINQSFSASGVKYSTDVSALGSVFYTITNGGNVVQPGGGPVVPPSTNKYQVVYSTSFTSGADGTTSMTINDIDGNPIIGFDIVQVENETKPLKNTEYSWNKTTAVLSLLGGVTCDFGMTLFVLYSKIEEA